MEPKYCLVLTTTNSVSNKQHIIDAILRNELAACIQTMPIESHYIWQQEVCCDNEFLLIIKTTNRCYSELKELIVRLHDYDVPQVIKVPFVEGHNPYLTWLDENTRR